jgi:hypothetical protein
MDSKPPRPSSPNGVIALGVAAGVGLGAVGLGTGVLGTAVTVAVVLAFGFLRPRFAMLAGGLLGMGVTWLLLFGNLALLCRQAAESCGQADVGPWLAGGLTFVVVGAVLLVRTLTNARRPAAPFG